MHTHDREAPSAESRATPVRDQAAPRAALALAAGRAGALDAGALIELQRDAGNAGVAGLLERSPVHDVVGSGGGTALDTDTRSFMEARLGRDFSDVRVHTDGAATESARSVGAHAYTVGTDVVVQADRWAPGTAEGDRLLAHELTHVVQQASGPVEGTAAPGGIQVSHPADRFEVEATRTAEAVVQRVGDTDLEEEPVEGGAA